MFTSIADIFYISVTLTVTMSHYFLALFNIFFLALVSCLPVLFVCLYVYLSLFACLYVHLTLCVRLFVGLHVDLWTKYNKPSKVCLSPSLLILSVIISNHYARFVPVIPVDNDMGHNPTVESQNPRERPVITALFGAPAYVGDRVVHFVCTLYRCRDLQILLLLLLLLLLCVCVCVRACVPDRILMLNVT